MNAPLWEQIADHLRGQITTGHLPPGTRLPTVSALARQWDVTRDTARGAYRRLEEEGLITGSPVRRVTALRPRIVHLTRPLDRAGEGEAATEGADSWRWDMIHAGERPELTVEVAVEPASAEVARWLGIDPGRRVVRRSNNRRTDGDPDSLADWWFPADLAERGPLATRTEPLTRGAIAYAEERWGPLTHWARMTARPPRDSEATDLHLAPGWPVVEVWRWSRSPGGRIVAAGRIIYAAQRTVLEMDLWPDRRKAPRPGGDWPQAVPAGALPGGTGCER